LEAQLVHYEETLQAQGTPLPYTVSVRERKFTDDFDAA